MELNRVSISQQVSNTEVTYDSVICFKNKIENKSADEIKNIIFKNHTNIDFDNRYYEFEKNRDNIELINEKGLIRIEVLLPGDQVIIYTSLIITQEMETENLIGYSTIKFLDLMGKEIVLKSNENIVNLNKYDEITKNRFILSVDKKMIEEDEIYNMNILVCNDGTSEIKLAEIYDIVPSNTNYIKDSLYINNSFINIGDTLRSIKLGNILPMQNISLSFSLKLNKKTDEKEILNSAKLQYREDNEPEMQQIKSNSVIVRVRKSEVGSFRKIPDKTEVLDGDAIEFEVICKNTGNVGIYDLIFKEPKDESFKFLDESFIVKEKRKKSIDIYEGIRVDYLGVGEEFKYKFSCIVKNISGVISNYSTELSYKYKGIDEHKYLEKKIFSKCDDIKIMGVNFEKSIKVIDYKSIFISEEVNYEITLKNSGNSDAQDVVLEEFLDSGIDLVPNSIKINDELTKINTLSNLIVGEIKNNSEIKITYRGIGIDISDFTNEEISEKCRVKYTYHVDKKKKKGVVVIKGDIVVVNGAIIREENVIKKINKVCVGLEDEIEVEILFYNSGNYMAEKVFIQENIGSSLRVVQNSLLINNIRKFYDIEDGILIGEINPLERINIKYKLKATSIPYNDIAISSTAIIYEAISSGNKTSTNMIISQSEEIKVRGANINFENGLFLRETNTILSDITKYIDFRIFLRNNGNENAYNVLLTEVLSENMIIKNNHVSINGKSKYCEENHIAIGTVKSGEDYEIRYIGEIIKRNNKIITTLSEIEYSYYIDGYLDIIKKTGKSNLVEVEIYDTNIIFNESLNKEIVKVGEVVEYSLSLINKGNIDIYNSYFKCELSENLNIQIIEYTINRSKQEVSSIYERVYIGDLNIDSLALVTLKFKILNNCKLSGFSIKGVLQGSYIESNNEVKKIEKTGGDINLKIDTNNLKIIKSTAKETYLKGEKIEILIAITNEGQEIAENILIEDSGLDFGNIENSITVNGRYLNKTYIGGIPIEMLRAGESAFIRYTNVYDNSYLENLIKTRMRTTAVFKGDREVYSNFKSDFSEHILFLKDVGVNIFKTANKKTLRNKDEVTFITTIKNKGDVDLYDLEITELNSLGLYLKPKGIYVNLKNINVDTNKISIPILRSKELCEITTEYNYKNYKSIYKISSKSKIGYKYKNYSGEEAVIESSNTIRLEQEQDIFKNINIEHKIFLEEYDNISIIEIIDTIVEVFITEQYVIKTIKNKSYSNNIMTGNKLIIRGYLEEKIEYVSNTVTEAVRLLKHQECFTVTMALPEEYQECDNIRIESKINDISYNLINKKNILNNVSLTMNILI